MYLISSFLNVYLQVLSVITLSLHCLAWSVIPKGTTCSLAKATAGEESSVGNYQSPRNCCHTQNSERKVRALGAQFPPPTTSFQRWCFPLAPCATETLKETQWPSCLHFIDQTLHTKFYPKLSLYGYISECVPLCAILCPEVFSVSSSNQAAVEMCLSSIQHTFPSFPVQGKGGEKGQQVPRSCSSEELGCGQGQAPRLPL